MKRTIRLGWAAGAALVILTLSGPVTAAAAQTGYPPGACTATVGQQTAGGFAVGQTFSIRLVPTCVFTVGSTVSLTVNGQSVGTKTAGSDGTVLVSITVLSAGQLSVNDPVLVTGQCGTNTVVATGPSASAGTSVTQTATFTVTCPATSATAAPGRVAFTGANVVRMSAVALALVAVGLLAVVVAAAQAASHNLKTPDGRPALAAI